MNTDADLSLLSNPSSLLFAVEKPNIFKDDLLETEILSSPDSLEAVNGALSSLEEALKKSKGGDGPLGVLGQELVCKWAFRLVQQRRLLGVSSEDSLLGKSYMVKS